MSAAVVLAAREQGGYGPWGELHVGGGIANPLIHRGPCDERGARRAPGGWLAAAHPPHAQLFGRWLRWMGGDVSGAFSGCPPTVNGCERKEQWAGPSVLVGESAECLEEVSLH